MYYKCELLIGGYIYPVTDYVHNWDEITASFKRNDYDGVVRTFTDKFEFVKGARTLLLNEYKENYLQASAGIVISTRNNSWTWVEQFRCSLNFSTLSDDGYITSINGVDNSVAALIKAKRGTQYEFSVEELAEKEQLSYDHLVMLNNIKWIDGGQLSDDNSNISFIEFLEDYSSSEVLVYSFPLYIESSEIYNKTKFEAVDIEMETYDSMLKVSPFFKAKDDITLHLSFSFQMYGTGMDATATHDSVALRFGKITQNKRYVTLGHWNVFNPEVEITNVKFDDDIELKSGEYLVFGFVMPSVKEGDRIYIVDSTDFSMSFYTRGSTDYMKLIKPSVLLNKILESMDEGSGLVGQIIESGEKRLDNAMILAAESVRKLPTAKIYTSFSKFSEWMKAVFGYVYDINGQTITFRHRNNYFQNKVVKTITDYGAYAMNINSSLIYSQLNVGYAKQDYDSVNGKDEFRFTNQYTTGIILTDNKLELISPYRADAYGIEFLSQKIGEETTDNSSDTDVFFVCAIKGTSGYTLDRTEEIEGVIDSESMFNVMYSPSSFILSNFAFLGSFIRKITFASSEGNSAVKIAQNMENRNIEINESLFSATNVEIETSDIELPSDMNGIVQFQHQGETIQGYYISTDYTYTKTKSCKISLVVKR